MISNGFGKVTPWRPINYRLVQHAHWQAQIEGVEPAIRWLKAHSNYYGCLANRIAVVGESAGGYLVAMLATTSGKRLFDVGENLDQTSDVTCAIDLFGPIDLTRLPALAAKLLGPERTEGQWGVKAHRQSNQLRTCQDEPPILIVHGTDDKLVPYEQAELLADAMDRVYAPYRFHTVVGGGHNPYFGLNTNPKTGGFDAGGGGIGLFEDPAVEPLIIEFLHQHLSCLCGVGRVLLIRIFESVLELVVVFPPSLTSRSWSAASLARPTVDARILGLANR